MPDVEATVEEIVNAVDDFLGTLDALPDSFRTQIVNFIAGNLGDVLVREYDPYAEAADYYHELKIERCLGHE